MKYVRRVIYALLLTAFLYINVLPLPKAAPTRRIQRLAEGAELLQLF